MLSFVNVYSQENRKDTIMNYSALENPFRSQKCNLLWNKARYTLHKLRTTYETAG